MKLPERFINEWGIKKHTFLEKFKSRQNQVVKFKVLTKDGKKRLMVGKYFKNDNSFIKEVSVMKMLAEKGACVPRIFFDENNLMISEYIDGALLVDEIYQKGSQAVMLLGEMLPVMYEKLDQIYGETPMILGDMNLRNFILDKKKEKIYRIDLESVRQGRISEDIGQMCAFCVSYDPPFTDFKIEFAKYLYYRLINKMNLTANEVKKELLKELSLIEIRRKIVIPVKLQESITAW